MNKLIFNQVGQTVKEINNQLSVVTIQQEGDMFPDKSDKVCCIYHGHCTDGLTSAAIVLAAIPSCSFIEGKHNYVYTNEELAQITDAVVYLVDFCLPVEQLLRLKAVAKKIVVLDHHETVIKDLKNNFSDELANNAFYYLTYDYSGAGLTYLYFKDLLDKEDRVQLKVVSDYVQDRDLWKFQLSDTKNYLVAFDTYAEVTQSVSEFLTSIRQSDEFELVSQGTNFNLYRTWLINSIIKKNLCIKVIDGYKVGLINTNFTFKSEIASEILKQNNDLDYALAYDIVGDKVLLSFRSLEKFDVTTVASYFNGGGHKQAAGASCILKQFLYWLN